MKCENFLSEIFSDLGELRNIKKEDLEAVLVFRNASYVRQNMFTQHVITPEEHLVWWQNLHAKDDQRHMIYSDHNNMCGIVSFTKINKNRRNAFWGFYTSSNAPKGTGTRMGALALDYAFYSLNLYKLRGDVLSFNYASLHLHRKLGFKIEKNLKECHKIGDKFINVSRFGLISENWQSQRVRVLQSIAKARNVES